MTRDILDEAVDPDGEHAAYVEALQTLASNLAAMLETALDRNLNTSERLDAIVLLTHAQELGVVVLSPERVTIALVRSMSKAWQETAEKNTREK